MSGASKRGGRSVLTILALFLAASAALRIGSGVGRALAATPEEPVAEAGVQALDCPAMPAALAAAFQARETELKARETALEDRLAALALADQAITTRLASLKQAEEELSATLSVADGASEQDLAQLTAAYAAMKPKDAAKLFEKMDPEFAAGFMGRMQPESVAQILGGMSPDAGYSISVLLAGRNALVPKQ